MKLRATIHYTEHGIPTHVTGGGTTRTRMNARQKRRLLRTAQRVWARATITWEPDGYDTTVVLARVHGVTRGRVVRSYDGHWTGRSDYTFGALRADGTQAGAKGRVETAIRRALVSA